MYRRLDLCLKFNIQAWIQQGKKACSSIKKRQLLIFTAHMDTTSAKDLGLGHQDTWAVWRCNGQTHSYLPPNHHLVAFRNDCFLSKYGSWHRTMTVTKGSGHLNNVHLPNIWHLETYYLILPEYCMYTSKPLESTNLPPLIPWICCPRNLAAFSLVNSGNASTKVSFA